MFRIYFFKLQERFYEATLSKNKKNYIFPHVDSISLSRCELACCSNVLKTNFELTSKEFKIKIHFRDDSLAKDLC